jgi:hypothetical protein
MWTPAITLWFPEQCLLGFFILEKQLASQNMFDVRYSLTVTIVSQKWSSPISLFVFVIHKKYRWSRHKITKWLAKPVTNRHKSQILSVIFSCPTKHHKQSQTQTQTSLTIVPTTSVLFLDHPCPWLLISRLDLKVLLISRLDFRALSACACPCCRLFALHLEPLLSPLSSLRTIMPSKHGAKFHLSELNFLLDNIENVMPIAGTEWDTVEVASFVNSELWRIMWSFCDT